MRQQLELARRGWQMMQPPAVRAPCPAFRLAGGNAAICGTARSEHLRHVRRLPGANLRDTKSDAGGCGAGLSSYDTDTAATISGWQ